MFIKYYYKSAMNVDDIHLILIILKYFWELKPMAIVTAINRVSHA